MIDFTFEIETKNPWWENASLIDADDKLVELSLHKFIYLHPLLESFPNNRHGVMTLRGPRQIGKTSLVKLIIRRLLREDKINPENVFYYSCENIVDFKELITLLKEYYDSYGYKNDRSIFVFLDEISFVKDWPRAIKIFTEGPFGKRTLFLLTGSSTVDLEFSSERLPGRRGQLEQEDVLFLPLAFFEFATLIKPEAKNWLGKEKFHLAQLRSLFKDYLLTGGFPAVINEYYDKNFISSNIYRIYLQWILGDMHKLGKSDFLTERIIQRLFASLTTPLSYYQIAKESSLSSHVTAFEYLDYLERLFALFRLDYFSLDQKRSDFKKNHKFYFYDQFILFTFLARNLDLLDQSFSLTKSKLKEKIFLTKLFENMVAIHLRRSCSKLFYGKLDQKEIDFVAFKKGVYHYFEVKYQENVDQKEFDFFSKKLPKEKLTVITKNSFYQGKRLSLVPLEIFLFSERF